MVLALRLCVLYGSQNKQYILPYATLVGFYDGNRPCLLRGTFRL